LRATGTIQHLYLKPARGKPMQAVGAGESVACVAGYGLLGDVHANRLSPRQVLVTLAGELDALRIAPGALLENIVIACDEPALFQPGAAIVAASGVEIRLTMFCEPCQRIAAVGHRLSTLLRRRGVLGVITTGGELRPGERIELIADKYPALPESPYQKFLEFLPTVPPGRVVRYRDITIAIGAADSFVRALPGYIKRSGGMGLPLHRIVNARGELLPLLPEQAARLRAEGVDLRGDNAVDLDRYLWEGNAG
jgi:alkylated DNA nucleotide flippase Atl1